jgi:ATP-dependent DNA helicase RecG
MERAVEVMTNSPSERRGDGKTSPLVGAVLWKPDGSTEMACRGELRDGDHAEFTLLERKNHSEKLDDAVLFSTLEPCAPGSRRHPKLSCAERIVLARIEEVWVGVEDPDPTVDRKGIKYLQENGVKVHMFDRDLQEQILDANRDFIAQAEERAAADRDGKVKKPVVLSALEAALQATEVRDLEPRVLDAYRTSAGIRAMVGSSEFNRRLVMQGLLQQQGGKLVPTGFGLLLFGREPRVRVPQAGLLGTIHYDDGTEETRDFEGPAVEVPEHAIQWIKDKLPNPISRSQAKRKERHESFFELLREGIVNALVHRDYAIEGAKCQLSVTKDKAVVMSPGLPVEPITLERLQAFDAPMLSRNPVMHFVFAKMDLAEERGLGLESMKSRAQQAELPLPSYSYKAPYVSLTLYRDTKAATADVGSEALGQMTDSERAGWDWIVTKGTITTAEYERALAVPNRTAKNHIKKLVELGLLRKKGAGRATRYDVVRS